MRSLIRFMIVFLLVTLGVALASGWLDVHFAHAEYWDRHGIFFLIAISMFPRLTLLLSGVPWGGVFWWLGWFFAPRLLVAVLATLNYWHQNPILVVIAWLVALGGESSEKLVVVRRGWHRGGRWGGPGGGGGRAHRRPGRSEEEEKFEKAEWVSSK